MDEGQQLSVTFQAKFERYLRGFEKAQEQTDKRFRALENRAQKAGTNMEKTFEKSSLRVGSILKNFGAGLAGGALGALSVAGLQQLAGQAAKVAEQVAQIGNEAKRAGMDSKSFQLLGYVAEQNRIPIDALVDGMKELNIQADEFILTGKGTGAEAFQRLGFSADDLRRRLKNPADLLVEIIGRLQQLDQAAQSRISEEIFGGTAGERFVELVRQGADGIRAQIAEANALGVVMSDEVIAKADELDRKWKAVATTIETRVKRAVIELLSDTADFWDRWGRLEEQNTRNLEGQLSTIGKRRLDIENQLLKLRREQAEAVPGNPFARDNTGAIQDLEAESAELAETEARVLRALGKRHDEAKTSAEEAKPAVQGLNGAINGTGSATDSATAGINSYTDALRALKAEIPELAEQLATLDARAKIDATYRKALSLAGDKGERDDAASLRDRALLALANKDQRAAVGKGMLDLIGYAEGTDKGRGYNETLAYGKFTGGNKNLVLMTLDQIDAMQSQMLAHPDNKFNSSAAGRYQIVQKTLRGLRSQLGLKGDEFFDASMQDRLAQELLRQRGNNPAGLRNEWEGLRRVDDASIRQAYDGTSVSMPSIDPSRAAATAKMREQATAYSEIVAGAKQYQQQMDIEQIALDLTAQKAAALRYEQDLLNQAQQRGIELTPQQRQELADLAQGMATAEAAAQSYASTQQQAAETSRFFKEQAVDALSGILTGTMTAEEALQQLIQTLIRAALQAAILGEGPLASLLGGGGSSGGGAAKAAGGSILGGILGLKDGGWVDASKHLPNMRYLAGGGPVSGPGGPRDDKVPAMLSDGEFVVNAAATKQHRAILEAINSGAVARFADGGIVGDDGTAVKLVSAGNQNGGAPTFNVNAPVTVNGSAGTEAQNQDLAKKMAKEMEATMRGVVADEMRRQTRPGNFGNSRAR